MFDPTVFENLKVGFENEVYDRDNLDQEIIISGRKDHLDLANMSRSFSLTFQLEETSTVQAEIHLHTDLENISAELLELPGTEPSCELLIQFECKLVNPERTCAEIEGAFKSVWERDLNVEQKLSQLFKRPLQAKQWDNHITLHFQRRITEEQMNDISGLIDYTINSLHALEQIAGIV
ncbi:hypothetical protein AB990_09935 [Alkalihalobacillus pseudalcaliphilus]|nr:hypothetical protein AB990_09935 [Alkalihalobacillus pseudalcaliphilus]